MLPPRTPGPTRRQWLALHLGAGALGLWNHQTGWLRAWGALGWVWPLGLAMLVLWLMN